MADAGAVLGEALQHHQAGRFAEAERAYRAILGAQPDHPDALHLLGVLSQQKGDSTAAMQLVRRAIEVMPAWAPFRMTLGVLLFENGDFSGAVAAHQEALQLDPSNAEVHNNLGNAYLKLGQLPAAAGTYRQAVALQKNHAEAHSSLANVLMGMGDLDEAGREARRAVELAPRSSRYASRLARALLRQSKYDDALSEAHRAVDLAVQMPAQPAAEKSQAAGMAYTVLGETLQLMNQTEDALDALRVAISHHPQAAEARCTLGGILLGQGLVAEAIAIYREALRLRPNMAGCHSNLLLALQSDETIGPADLLNEHLEWARQHVPQGRAARMHANDRSAERRLRIGYVSGDFREHSVARFFLPLLESHDQGQVEVFCYSTIERPDAITDRIRRAANHWRDVTRLSDDELADAIQADRVDVLVDLAGHTRGNRLTAFALKPAPVQVSWCGWPGTTGVKEIDFRITDVLADPPGAEAHSVEEVFRIRPPFLCYGATDDAPAVAKAPVVLNGFVTFGSFNNPGKLSPGLMRAWGRILEAVKESRLVLKAVALGDPRTQEKVKALLAQHGVDPNRVQIRGPEAETSSHLAAYGLIDVGLDTFPYNGTTTTCEALYMGVPVITLAGQTHVSRVGLSLLSAVGLNDLSTESVDGYIAAAIRLATDVGRIGQLRETLRLIMTESPLMDRAGFAREMEAAYRGMWRRWCEGEKQG